MHSNSYTFMYAAIISLVTAVILAFTSESLKPLQESNVALDQKRNILRSVRLDYPEREQIESTYAEGVQELVLKSDGSQVEGVDINDVDLKKEVAKSAEERMLPLYIYSGEGEKQFYVIPVRGVGLWGPIWGFVSIEGDFNTVYGAYFDHKAETPGLGAEIAEKFFQVQFEGKKLMSDEGEFVSVRVLKATEKFNGGDEHRVDGISGGTITSRGTDAMLIDCIEPYLTYFEKQKSSE